jgi:hypothetical protein
MEKTQPKEGRGQAALRRDAAKSYEPSRVDDNGLARLSAAAESRSVTFSEMVIGSSLWCAVF